MHLKYEQNLVVGTLIHIGQHGIIFVPTVFQQTGVGLFLNVTGSSGNLQDLNSNLKFSMYNSALVRLLFTV